MVVIGLTGNSGSGKSKVAMFLKDNFNAYIIDADKIGHDVIMKENECYDEIVTYFGNDILDENAEIDRKILGSVVFNDKSKLKKLSEITHKYICKIIIDESDKLKREPGGYSSIIIDGALILETHIKDYVDHIWVVIADTETRIKRLQKRQNLNRDKIVKRIKSQWQNNQYIKFADVVIDNSNDFGFTRQQCIKAFEKAVTTK